MTSNSTAVRLLVFLLFTLLTFLILVLNTGHGLRPNLRHAIPQGLRGVQPRSKNQLWGMDFAPLRPTLILLLAKFPLNPLSPTTGVPARLQTFKENIELSFHKRLGPFITRTSTIFQEVIGGRATGETEPEEEQADRRVHGFVYPTQGKRRTVFMDAASAPIATPRPSRAIRLVSSTVPLPHRPPPPVRTSRTPRTRTPRARQQEDNEALSEPPCKICASYTQLRRVAALLTTAPDIPLRCGLCENKTLRTRVEKTVLQPWDETATPSTSTPTPTPTAKPSPRIKLLLNKRPLEAEAGTDQMTVQMMADVQRNPRRARRLPARLTEL